MLLEPIRNVRRRVVMQIPDTSQTFPNQLLDMGTWNTTKKFNLVNKPKLKIEPNDYKSKALGPKP